MAGVPSWLSPSAVTEFTLLLNGHKAVVRISIGPHGADLTADLFAIDGDLRYGLGVSMAISGSVLESDRNLIQPSGDREEGRFRTLVPRSDRVALNGIISRPIGEETAATIEARFETSDAESLIGLNGGSSVERNLATRSFHAGTTISGRSGRYRWTFTGNADRNESTVATKPEIGPKDTASFDEVVFDALFLFNGPIAELPTGSIGASVSAGVSSRFFQGESMLRAGAKKYDLSRTGTIVGGSVDVPLLANRRKATSPIGDLSVNGNFSVETLSDFGRLTSFGYGVSWAPAEGLNVIASSLVTTTAPSLEQLGGPIVSTSAARVLDFTRLETVEATRLFGGNSGLQAQRTRSFRIGMDAKPFATTDLFLTADYLATEINDQISTFPILTPQVERAFQDRIERDANGNLLALDGRPLNFERSGQKQLRWGVNYSRRLGPVPPGFESAGARVFNSQATAQQAFPGTRVVVAEAGSPLAKGMENLSSRIYLSIYHTWFLEDVVALRQGFPELNLLESGALDPRGGRRRHALELQAGAFKGGLGGRLSAIWQSSTRIGDVDDAIGTIDFGPTTAATATFFANLAEAFPGLQNSDVLKGTRASLSITNLFNTRPDVGRESGPLPLTYQPGYLDPIGRTVSFNLRKVF